LSRDVHTSVEMIKRVCREMAVEVKKYSMFEFRDPVTVHFFSYCTSVGVRILLSKEVVEEVLVALALLGLGRLFRTLPRSVVSRDSAR
jgi:hypothetical protein